MRRVFGPALVLSALLGSATARADDGPAPDLRTKVRVTRWYGWQNASVDAVMLVLTFDRTGSSDVTPGEIGWLGGSAVIHLLHGRVDAAAGSVALRFGLPLAGGVVGLIVNDCRSPKDTFCPAKGV